MESLQVIIQILIFVVIVCFCLLFGYFCASIAKKQGREPGTAGVLGFFFGIIALLIYLMLGDKFSSAHKENTICIKNCPYCSEEIQETAKKCKHCGEWLDDKKKHHQTEKKNH